MTNENIGRNVSVFVQSLYAVWHLKFIIQARCHCQYLVKHIVDSLLVFLLIGINIVCSVR